MDNSIDAIFKWKNSVKNSVEKIHEKDKYVSSWDKIDVMYWLTENEMELPIVQIVKPLMKIFWKEPFWKPSVY